MSSPQEGSSQGSRARLQEGSRTQSPRLSHRSQVHSPNPCFRLLSLKISCRGDERHKKEHKKIIESRATLKIAALKAASAEDDDADLKCLFRYLSHFPSPVDSYLRDPTKLAALLQGAQELKNPGLGQLFAKAGVSTQAAKRPLESPEPSERPKKFARVFFMPFFKQKTHWISHELPRSKTCVQWTRSRT